MSKESTIKKDVKSGLRRAFGWVLGCIWFAVVIWGITNAFGSEANFFEGRHPSRVLGYAILGLAGAVLTSTANRWKRVFPGIMLSATLGALLELEQGHALNDPATSIPRSIALVQLLVIAVVTVLSFTFKKRPLNIGDRIALLAFAVSILLGGQEATGQKLPLALIVGGLCVLAAWGYDRVRRRPANSSPVPTA